MKLEELQPGDLVYAATDIYDDEGSLPGSVAGALIAPVRTRGVILNVGHLEEEPEKELYLVRFETEDKELGSPVGCWPEELTTMDE
jgi:nitrogen fixation protein NifZ